MAILYHCVVDEVMLNKNGALFSIGLLFLLVDSLSREPLSGEAMNVLDSGTKAPSASPNRFLTHNTHDLAEK